MDTLASRLEKVKSTMDNGSFVFCYEDRDPVAFHKDWLLKEYNVSVTDYKNEKINKIVIEEEGVGILLSGGRLVVPQSVLNDSQNKFSCVNDYIPKFIDGLGNAITQKVRDFVFYKTANSHVIYVLTELDILYYVDLKATTKIGVKIDNPGTIKNLYGCSNALYLLTYEGNIYVAGNNTHGELITGTSSPTHLGIGANLFPTMFVQSIADGNKLLKIITRYGKTFLMYTNNLVKAYGNGAHGCLTTGNSENVTENGEYILDFAFIKDIAIGKNHVLFLLEDSNSVVMVGQTKYGQLGLGDYEEETLYEPILLESKKDISHIQATQYGSIFLDRYGRFYYTGTFVNKEIDNYINSEDRGLATDTLTIDDVTYNYIYQTKTIRKKTGAFVRNNRNIIIDRVKNTGMGILFDLENGECVYTGSNIYNFMGSSMGTQIDAATNIDRENNDINRNKISLSSKWSVEKNVLTKMNIFNGSLKKNIFYKNSNGVWINWQSLFSSFNLNSLAYIKDANGNSSINYPYFDGLAKSKENLFTIAITKIPAVQYVDMDGIVYQINKHDGKKDYDFQDIIPFDTFDYNKLKIELFNRQKETEGIIITDICNKFDVRLTIVDPEIDLTFKEALVWMNGSFPPFEMYPTNHRSEYLVRGTDHIPTIRKCESLNTPAIKKTPGMGTVAEPSRPTELRWDFNIRSFAWENVEITQPYMPNIVINDVFVFRSKSISIPYKLGFGEDLIEDTFILLMNGVVVSEKEYKIDITNPKRIILKGFEQYILTLFSDIIGNNENINAFYQLTKMISNIKFTIVRFKSKIPNKIAKVYRDRSTLRNSPYPGNISFEEVLYNDLILIDGHYIPYLWEHIKSIRIPDTLNTIHDSLNDFINFSDIYRLKVYLE